MNVYVVTDEEGEILGVCRTFEEGHALGELFRGDYRVSGPWRLWDRRPLDPSPDPPQR